MSEYSKVICSFLTHEEYLIYRRTCISNDFDILDEIFSFLRYWTYKCKPSRRIRDLARTYLRSKNIPIDDNTLIGACCFGNVLLLKLLLLSGVNVYVKRNKNMKVAYYGNHLEILKILMIRHVQPQNIYNLFDTNSTLLCQRFMIDYIVNNKYYIPSKNTMRFDKCYGICTYGTRTFPRYMLGNKSISKELHKIYMEHEDCRIAWDLYINRY